MAGSSWTSKSVPDRNSLSDMRANCMKKKQKKCSIEALAAPCSSAAAAAVAVAAYCYKNGLAVDKRLRTTASDAVANIFETDWRRSMPAEPVAAAAVVAVVAVVQLHNRNHTKLYARLDSACMPNNRNCKPFSH